MVKQIFLLVFICLLLESCEKKSFEDIPDVPIQSDYFSDQRDTLKFQSFGKNPFVPIDTVIWTKIYDELSTSNSRRIGYRITDFKGHRDFRTYILEPNKLKSSSDSARNYLSIYKTYLMDDTTQNFYYERSGKYTRFFSPKLFDVQTNYFSGKCIWTYLEFSELLNDSMSRKTIIDEYYAFKIGIIKIRQEDTYYVNGKFASDSICYKYRFQ